MPAITAAVASPVLRRSAVRAPDAPAAARRESRPVIDVNDDGDDEGSAASAAAAAASAAAASELRRATAKGSLGPSSRSPVGADAVGSGERVAVGIGNGNSWTSTGSLLSPLPVISADVLLQHPRRTY